jgi:hypothetical protein
MDEVRGSLDSVVIAQRLESEGMDYARTPKGLIPFHRYGTDVRTPVEEHLVEAAELVRDAEARCRVHVTVAAGDEGRFEALLKRVRSKFERKRRVSLAVRLSEQRRETETVSLASDGTPFRDSAGSLLFRPGGHGALLLNLNHLGGDLVYLKNIDNVVPDHLKKTTVAWKKILGGFLLQTQRAASPHLERIQKKRAAKKDLEGALDFLREVLSVLEPSGFWGWPAERRQEFLLKKLDRPLRVCGVVKNQGEPGGGPFWVKGRDGSLTLQIVESAQVDLESDEQHEIWFRATHFNPVDLVCSLRDFQGRPFDLRRHVDPEAVFISRKSRDGQALQALELPGLWNGAMADWNTLFVEVPLETFSPVKTILDLLRPEHQPPET